jgi:MerR family transcriptional regulator/heat shock protein HspR
MADDLFPKKQGVFMISVAARLAGMHPQTLRVYEERGLIKPQRSPKQTRLYSQRDVERLKRIQELTTLGMNLAGVERVLDMEERMDAMHERMEAMQREMLARIDEVHRSYKRELVRWEPPQAQHGQKIQIQRPARDPSGGLPPDGDRSRRREPEA